MPQIVLPSIAARAKIITKEAVHQGELAHVRIQLPGEKGEYFVVPRDITRRWVELGVNYAPGSVSHDAFGGNEPREGMAAVKVRYGKRETKAFLVSPLLAIEWRTAARDLERLQNEYNRIIYGR